VVLGSDYGILDDVTAKEQLHELVDALDDEQADRALSVLSTFAGRVPMPLPLP
jgi:hypothetical protein